MGNVTLANLVDKPERVLFKKDFIRLKSQYLLRRDPLIRSPGSFMSAAGMEAISLKSRVSRIRVLGDCAF